jgi:hypothetical protein
MNRFDLHAPMTAPRMVRGVLACALWSLGLAACGGMQQSNVGGTLSGLNAGASVTVRNNNADTMTLTENGPFHFPVFVPGGNPYNVVVLVQPVGQTCTVANGRGTLDDAADPVTVTVTCVST